LILETISLVVARVVASNTSGGMDGAVQGENVGATIAEIFDRRAVDTTFVNSVVGVKGSTA